MGYLRETERGWEQKSQVRRLNCQKHSKGRAFHSCRIRGHCYFLAGVESCRLDLEVSTGPRTRVQEYSLLDFTPDPRPLPHFLAADWNPSPLMVKGLVGMGWSAERGKPDELCLPGSKMVPRSYHGKQSRDGGFRPVSLATCASPRTGFFAFLGLRCLNLPTERLLWMIAMVLSSLRMYKISSALLI